MRVNEIFYSIQGEGAFSGVAAIFIRLSGCNLKCPFCDTDHFSYKEMGLAEITKEIVPFYPCRFVVITGGEPTIHSELPELISLLHDFGYFVAIETNGTSNMETGADWITVSPKADFCSNATIQVRYANEVKVVFDGEHCPSDYGIQAQNYFVQPCDTGDKEKNEEIIQNCLTFIKEHPKWKLSLQIQKILKVR